MSDQLKERRTCLDGSRQQHRIVPIAASAIVLAFTSAAFADILEFRITLDGSQENPPVVTDGSGSGTAMLDTDTLEFSWNIEYADLNGNPAAAHFHGPAANCVNGGVRIPLPFESPIVGSATVSAQEATDILAGLWYVNVHSDLHGSGEIRGQVEPASINNPIPTPIPFGDRIRLTPIASGLTAPNWGTSAPGIDGRLYVSDQNGVLWNVNLATGDKSVFLDVQDRLVPLGIFGENTFDERGLLGVAFDPDYSTNGLIYSYTSEPFDANVPGDFSTMPVGVDPNHQTVIAEWNVPTPNDPDAVVDPSSVRVLLRIDQPQFNHDGGTITFGPDELLYVSLGDGGAGDDQETGVDPFGQPNLGHGCNGNGQDPLTILGTVIRIDPHGSNSSNGEYGIPADNPFVGEDAVEETYAYGLRNPFRMSFDQQSGDLYVADVGQNHIEEINVVESGDNLGWNTMEGTFRFVRNGASAGYAVAADHIDTTGLTMPIAQYDHDEGLAIIGGFVYRGARVPSIAGRYLFGEFARTFQNDGRVFYLNDDDDIIEFDVADGGFNRSLLGFGQDADGEVYVLANSTGVPFGETGEVLRVDPPLLLESSGECPGRIEFTVSGARPGSRVAFIRATGRGNAEVPPGIVCEGTTLSLDRTLQLGRVVTADANGSASAAAFVGQGFCGKVFVQVVELDNSSNCATSNVVIAE